ncbi:MAG: BON domain-containing protein [Planctomycetota bacterium]
MPAASKNATSTHAARKPRAHNAAAREQSDTLAARIRERITKRLGPRVRDLRVSVTGKLIVLSGRCSTYYSKQLAQHAALGVIEDEQLDNAIEVAIAR